MVWTHEPDERYEETLWLCPVCGEWEWHDTEEVLQVDTDIACGYVCPACVAKVE